MAAVLILISFAHAVAVAMTTVWALMGGEVAWEFWQLFAVLAAFLWPVTAAFCWLELQ